MLAAVLCAIKRVASTINLAEFLASGARPAKIRLNTPIQLQRMNRFCIYRRSRWQRPPKVTKNRQRDLNIASRNAMALIFDLMDIHTKDVLVATATKWTFFLFTPCLVCGHCISVDLYYLTSATERLSYWLKVILPRRRINDSIGSRVTRKAVKQLIQ